jgi:ABC-type amino acid transport substrate-binding protein
MTDVQFTNEPIGIAVKKENTELVAKLNAALDELKADGTLKAISEEWLGDDYTSDIDEELNFVETE